MLHYLLIVSVAASACAQHVDARADAERAVCDAIDAFYSAAARRDWDAAGGMMSPSFEIYTDGAAGFDKAAYVALLKADDLVVERMSLHDVRIRVAADGRMAWASFRGSFTMTSHGKRHDVRTAETLILSRVADRWLIDRAHASVAPQAP